MSQFPDAAAKTTLNKFDGCAGMAVAAIDILDQGSLLRITTTDGETMAFHALWLRDNDQGPSTRDPGNGQRLISITDLNPDIRIRSASLESDTLHLKFDGDDTDCQIPLPWLRGHRYDLNRETRDTNGERLLSSEIQTWDTGRPPPLTRVDFGELVNSETALRDWLTEWQKYGVVRCTGMPREEGSVCSVAELFGFVRETNYGKYFDVRSVADPVNLAYTRLGLEAHSDNPYRDPVPTLQLLACLENSTQGGESIVVDGFRVAAQLQDESSEHFGLLSSFNANFRFAGDDSVDLSSSAPLIDLDPRGKLRGVRYNNRSIAPFAEVPFERMNDFYRAYRQLAELVSGDEFQVEFRLEEGDMFMVDNTRVLHARRSISGDGERWLQGCYADRDGLLSTLRVLNQRLPSQ